MNEPTVCTCKGNLTIVSILLTIAHVASLCSFSHVPKVKYCFVRERRRKESHLRLFFSLLHTSERFPLAEHNRLYEISLCTRAIGRDDGKESAGGALEQ